MKNIAFLIAMLVSFATMAQRTDTEKLEALEVAFLTQELQLTADEAQKFWPIFNEIKEERNDLKKAKRKLMVDMAKNYNTMSEDLAEKYVDDMFDLETALNESNFESRHRKIIKILGNKRFLQLKKAEVEFRHQLLRNFSKRGKKIP